MANDVLLKSAIITNSAKLACESDESGSITSEECVREYSEQFEDGSYLTHLRMWIGYMIEQGSKKAVDIMKDLIKYRLATR